MKKAVIILVLVIFILGNLGFIVLRSQANGSENNFFNQNLRSTFARNAKFRALFNLHNDGDAKSDYLGTRYSKIQIEVDSMQGLSVPKASLDLLTSKIADITGKQVTYFFSDGSIPFAQTSDINDIDQISKSYRNFKNIKDTVGLYLLNVNQFAEQPDQVGSTFEEYGIALFASVLQEFTKNNPETLDNYIESTVLHEFGHQIGLPHNDFSDCLMTAYADYNPNGYTSAESVITDFCTYEKNLVRGEKL